MTHLFSVTCDQHWVLLKSSFISRFDWDSFRFHLEKKIVVQIKPTNSDNEKSVFTTQHKMRPFHLNFNQKIKWKQNKKRWNISFTKNTHGQFVGQKWKLVFNCILVERLQNERLKWDVLVYCHVARWISNSVHRIVHTYTYVF